MTVVPSITVPFSVRSNLLQFFNHRSREVWSKSVLCTIIWAAYRQDKVTEVDGSVSSRPALKTQMETKSASGPDLAEALDQWLPRNQKIGQMHRIQIFSQQPQCRVQVVLEVTQKPGEAPSNRRGSWGRSCHGQAKKGFHNQTQACAPAVLDLGRLRVWWYLLSCSYLSHILPVWIIYLHWVNNGRIQGEM